MQDWIYEFRQLYVSKHIRLGHVSMELWFGNVSMTISIMPFELLHVNREQSLNSIQNINEFQFWFNSKYKRNQCEFQFWFQFRTIVEFNSKHQWISIRIQFKVQSKSIWNTNLIPISMSTLFHRCLMLLPNDA